MGKRQIGKLMENIKESLLMAMLENQCKILAELKSLERRFDSEYIMRHNGRFDALDQLKTIESNVESDFKKILSETYDRAEQIEKQLSRDTTVFQEL